MEVNTVPWFCRLWGACILPWFRFHLTWACLWRGFLFLLVSHRHVSLSLAYKQTRELSNEQQDSSKLRWRRYDCNRHCSSLHVSCSSEPGVCAPMVTKKYTGLSPLSCSSAGHFAVQTCDVWCAEKLFKWLLWSQTCHGGIRALLKTVKSTSKNL